MSVGGASARRGLPWLKKFVPWALLLLYGLWLTGPMWANDRRIFTREVSGDGIISAWVYDSVARTVARGETPWLHTDLDYPNHLTRVDHAPGLLDAILVAPITLFFDWPQQLGAVQGTSILAMGFSLAWLMAALGGGPWSILVAGSLGMSMWPQWYQLEFGRLNTAWPSLAFASVAAYLGLLQALVQRPEAGRPWGKVLLYFSLSVFFGWFLLATYPPYAMMLAPIAAAILFMPLWRSGPVGLMCLSASLGLGLALAYQDMQYLMQWRTDNALGICDTIQCPRLNQIVPFSLTYRMGPGRAYPLLDYAGMAIGSWCLVPLGLLFSRRRILAAFILLGAAMTLYLAVGPCWDNAMASVTGTINSRQGQSWEVALWCRLRNINDYSRFALIGMGGLAILSGMGLQGLQARLPRWGAYIAAILTVAVALQTGWMMRSDLRFDSNWAAVPLGPSAEFLQNQPPGVVGGLPFDSSHQFMSIMDAPSHSWVNPLNVLLMRPSGQPFVEWLKTLGLEKIPESAPSIQDIQDSGVTWVLFEPGRCAGTADGLLCREKVPEALRSVLGEPTDRQERLWVWTLSEVLQRKGEGAGVPETKLPLEIGDVRNE